MAELVTIRHKQTQRERQVAESAVAYFPDHEVVKTSSKTNEKKG